MGVRLLLLLHEHLDELVTRRAIYDALWPDSEIDVDRGLNTLIRHVRRGLGDSTDSPRFIRTYPGRGYRLLPIQDAPVASRPTRRPLRFRLMAGVSAAAVAGIVALAVYMTEAAAADEPRVPAAGVALSAGRHLLRQVEVGERARAANFLERALTLEPALRGARAELAEAYFWAGKLDTAARLAEWSTRHEPAVARGWFMRGVLRHLNHWDWAGARADLQEAIRRDPSRTAAYTALAFVEVTAGRTDAARDALGIAMRTNTADAVVLWDAGQIYLYMGDAAHAIQTCRLAVDLAPVASGPRRCLLDAHLAAGDTARALGFLPAGSPRLGTAAETLLAWRAREGEQARFVAAAAPVHAAERLALAGFEQEALQWLRVAVEQRSPWAIVANAAPGFRHLRGRPQFHDIIAPVLRASAGLPAA